MNIRYSISRFGASLAAAALIVAGVNLSLAKAPDPDATNSAGHGEKHIKVCVEGKKGGDVGCHARVVVDEKGSPKAATAPSGYSPAHFRGAYGLNAVTSTQTIAIVDAYDDPKIKSDLDTYNAAYGLPSFPNCSSTLTTSCFQKVNQRGGTSYPAVNAGWALEIALDVEVAHGICPSCKLVLVEADSNSYTNLLTAVDRAVTMGANVVSMSWGSNEFSSETSFDSHFAAPGVAFTVSSGDSGFGAEYPAASPNVTAVGGTTLTLSGINYVNESAWSGSGSGCSAYEAKPLFQTALGLVACPNRMIADVSADADPSTGAAVYDSVRFQGRSGWFKVGGTSLSSPIVASVFALAANASSISPANGYPYAHTANLHDVTSGSNGPCSPDWSFLCTAGVGYDGPTGLGSPNGILAF